MNPELARTPPMGWNSWDCFGVSVTEEEVKQNADYMAQNLLQYGWEYIVVDLGWYLPSASKDDYKQVGINQLIDPYGRLIPAPGKFPSSAEGNGLRPLADYVHALGLKFGLHIMRGIPVQAVAQDTPILGSRVSAGSVGQPEDRCLWYQGMMGVNLTREGGQAYYDSIVQMYADWGVDFIKAGDINSWDGEGNQEPYHTDEVEALASAIERCGRPIVLSLSPGAARVCNANHLRRHANMWRISCDFWDDWPALKRQFDRCRLWASYICEGGWPDADMLPLGRIGIRGEVGEARLTHFTENEQRTLMTLWCILRSPLMFGGHLPETDPLSLAWITNQEALTVNQQSCNNRQLFRDQDRIAWAADIPGQAGSYLALFNAGEEPEEVAAGCDLMGIPTGTTCAVRDLWTGRDLGTCTGEVRAPLEPHDAALFSIRTVN